MRTRPLLAILALLLPLAFLAGWLASRGGDGGGGERKVLYWVDPMNPSFRSPAPGTAPCGMPLEPVFVDGPAPGPGSAQSPGSVQVRGDRLQLIGVARQPVRREMLRHTLRLVGTVAPDETRLFRLAAATEGRIREMGSATTGSLVRKGEIFAAYYSQEAWVPQQNYIRLLETYRMLKKTGSNPHDNMQGGNQLATYEMNLMATRQTLLNLGMTPEQIEEIAERGQPAYLIQVRAPSDGFIIARNVSFGQSFREGDELYVVADLGHVWILADAFEGQEEYFAPGTAAVVSQTGSGRRYAARVSAVSPRFDAVTRTLKVRLEAANPGLLLRPDMFVDVELPVAVGPGIFLPKEAVLDSGTRRVVFVEQEPGIFAPRTVRTGRRLGEHVEIVAGLMEGETVVTSGNFLLDSESRMRSAGVTSSGAVPMDPVCGMEVDEGKARAAGLVSEHGGKNWFFCSPGCKQSFDRDPRAAAARALGTPEAEPAPMPREGSMDMGVPAMPDAVHVSSAPGADAIPRMTSGPAHADHASGMREDAPPTMPVVPEQPGQATAIGQESRAAAGMMPSPGRMGDPGFKRDWAVEGQRRPDPIDPVCGMVVNEAQAFGGGLVSQHEGKTHFFCTPECKQSFDKDPEIFVQSSR